MIWLTSDTHYSHANIIKYCNRPFPNKTEMDEHLISEWNRMVKPEDTVYHLGDVGFCNKEYLIFILSRLNGTKHLILGNHDKTVRRYKEELLSSGLVASIQDYLEITYEGKLIGMFHHPIGQCNKKPSKPLDLYVFGHVHGGLPSSGICLDVGVDNKEVTSEYRPISIEEIIKFFELKNRI